MVLRAVLLAAAGAASLAYLALRQKAPPLLRRELDPGSLSRHVGNWLPKLPYLPCIRIGTLDADLVEITGDGSTVQIRLLRGDRRCLEVPADSAAVAEALESVLRCVFGIGPASTLSASVPAAG